MGGDKGQNVWSCEDASQGTNVCHFKCESLTTRKSLGALISGIKVGRKVRRHSSLSLLKTSCTSGVIPVSPIYLTNRFRVADASTLIGVRVYQIRFRRNQHLDIGVSPSEASTEAKYLGIIAKKLTVFHGIFNVQVGILEHWDISMALFNARIKSPVHDWRVGGVAYLVLP